MRIVNFGSLNIDHVYRVDHIARPGETIASRDYQVFAGGKGANQSVALARAGAAVAHAGVVGRDGTWLINRLADCGVDTQFTRIADVSTGCAIIQVAPDGENAIVLFPGCNHAIEREHVDQVFTQCAEDDMLLLQNEINDVPYLIEAAHRRGLRVAFNPAPLDDATNDYPLEYVDLLFVNETEGHGLTGETDADAIARRIVERLPKVEVVVTRGRDGALYRRGDSVITKPAQPVDAVDATGAGDTFIGYFLATYVAGGSADQALIWATRAAALCVARPGAMDSIPTRDMLT
ncbi:MAG: ribokinase [Phycisphaeraceae bacterium]|nr:ribokinase [Phycisphaeraceae bacterium]